MSESRRTIVLIILGCFAIVAGILVAVRNWRDWDIDILATVAVVGGIAMIVVALPSKKNADD